MAMVRVTPTPVLVKCDPFDGRPVTVQIADAEIAVTSIDRVRDESAAFRVEIGPRTIFEVSTSSSRLQLAYLHRRRRWIVEGIDQRIEQTALAA